MKNFWQVLKAINAMAIGVGKKQDLVKDLDKVETTGPWQYIIAALIFTVLFILTIVLIVNLVL